MKTDEEREAIQKTMDKHGINDNQVRIESKHSGFPAFMKGGGITVDKLDDCWQALYRLVAAKKQEPVRLESERAS